MSTHLPGFQSFFRFWHNFVLVKLVTNSIRVKVNPFMPRGLLNPLMLTSSSGILSSASMIHLMITLEMGMILQNI